MEIRVIGIDLGKSVFHLVGMDKRGKVVARNGSVGLPCVGSSRSSDCYAGGDPSRHQHGGFCFFLAVLVAEQSESAL